jgi:serine O-acetyltransferase
LRVNKGQPLLRVEESWSAYESPFSNTLVPGHSFKYGVPFLGKNVYVGAGAKILGPIAIGDDVVIGANAVVVTSIPSNSLAVGVPARVIKSGIQKSDYV